MADTMSLGRTTQLGVETTHGSVPASGARAQLTDLIIQPDPAYGTTAIRGTGRRFNAATSPDGMEHIAGKLAGGLGYNSFTYPTCMCMGNPVGGVPTTPTNAVTARQWKWVLSLTGSIDPRSMDLEQGDANDSEQILNTILTDLGIDVTRAACAPAGTLLGRALNKASASGPFTGMTVAGVTAIPIVPVLPKEWSVFMDTTSAGIGVTQLSRCFHAAFKYSGAYLPFYPIDARNASFAGTADNPAVQTTALLELMKDPLVGEALWVAARTVQKRYIRLVATSSQYLDNLTLLNGQSAYSAGNVGLTYKGVQITFPFNALGSAIQTALAAHPAIGAGNVTVSPSGTAFNTNTTFTITMTGALANDAAQITVTTQPTGGTVVPTPVQIPYSLQIDFCAEVRLPGPFADNQALRVRQWDFDIVEDPTWSSGQAVVITLTNALTALL